MAFALLGIRCVCVLLRMCCIRACASNDVCLFIVVFEVYLGRLCCTSCIVRACCVFYCLCVHFILFSPLFFLSHGVSKPPTGEAQHGLLGHHDHRRPGVGGGHLNRHADRNWQDFGGSAGESTNEHQTKNKTKTSRTNKQTNKQYAAAAATAATAAAPSPPTVQETLSH